MRVLTFAVLLSVLSLACGGGERPSLPIVGTLAPPEPAVWPLRGTTAANADEARRRPIVVKVANDPAARPQTGLAQADLVFEIVVEAGLTRYAMVFHSQEPDRVGPVRSARQSDLGYVPMLRPILVHVGASEAVAKLVRDAARSGSFVDVDEFEHADAFIRTTDRQAPYNAYTTGAKAREAAGAKGREKVSVPALPFDATVKATKAESTAAGTSLVVPYRSDADRVRYEYDSAVGAYRRTQGAGRTTDGGREVLPENVVIIKTDVREISGTADVTGAASVDFRATGSGPLVVLRDGKRFDGSWSRSGDDMYELEDATGATIALKPGLTWIHIVPMDFAFD